jgi:hypothetical protein
MELWVGQIVDPNDLSIGFAGLGEDESLWEFEESGTPHAFGWNRDVPTLLVLDQSAPPDRVYACTPYEYDADIMIIGVEVELSNARKEIRSGWFQGDICFDITQIALLDPSIAQARITQVTALLRERGLPHDKVGFIWVATPKI